MFSHYGFLRLFFYILLLVFCLNTGAETQPSAKKTVMQWMMQEIVPQSTLLWGADNPESDEEWSQLLSAAEKIIRAAKAMQKNALSDQGTDWSKQSDWQTYNSEMKAAADHAKEAILEKNLDKLFKAGDDLYPPCEGCHLQFNPAVSEDS
ncbi:MAG: hypothetical protein GKR93_08775 [Gammaproteobacteria bacterium]|nr:hypothetical protein [Gammaproteobacteria bacterium]